MWDKSAATYPPVSIITQRHKGGIKTYTSGVDDIVEGELGDQGVELEEEG